MIHLDGKFIRRGLAALGALALPLIASAAPAADYTVGPMHVAQPWARATPKGATSGAGYLSITNTGTAPDRVSCVSSDASARCEIHSMSMEGGVMKMRPVEGGLEVKPGDTVTLKPGSFHIMLLDLKHPLKAGQTVEATLQFTNAGTVKVELPVLAMGAPAPGAAGGGNMMHGGGMMQMNKQ
jgi:periplasmic copper chaperone A